MVAWLGVLPKSQLHTPGSDTARCVHCKQWAWPHHAELDLVKLTDLIQVFRYWGVKTITFGGGNPLLHEHFISALEMARGAEMHVGIISEGCSMSAATAEAIARHAAWIRFSLDGPNAGIHDRIRNTPGLFANVVASISALQRHKTGLQIGLNCVVQKRNVNLWTEMIRLAEELGVSAVLFKLPHGDDPGRHFLLSHDDLQAFVQWVSARRALGTRVTTNLLELHALMDSVFA